MKNLRLTPKPAGNKDENWIGGKLPFFRKSRCHAIHPLKNRDHCGDRSQAQAYGSHRSRGCIAGGGDPRIPGGIPDDFPTKSGGKND